MKLGIGGVVTFKNGKIDQFLNQIDLKHIANIEEYVEDLSHIVVAFISKVFEGETIFTRSQKKTDGSFDFNRIEVPKVDPKNFQYTFAINLDHLISFAL